MTQHDPLWQAPGVTHPPVVDDSRERSRTGLFVGVVVVVCLALCGAIVAVGDRLRGLVGAGPAVTQSHPATRSSPAQPDPLPTADFAEPTSIVEGGPEASFRLPIGTGVRFEDQDGTWTVAVLGAHWVDGCADLLGDTGHSLVVDIRVESLTGGVSVIPFNDFRYRGADDITSSADLMTACGSEALAVALLHAGDVLTGAVAFSVRSGVGGELEYGQFSEPTASWLVTEG